MGDEYLDLVDSNDIVIGRQSRREIYAKGLHNFRCVGAFLVNSKGELWIPLRSASRAVYPLSLDFSVGGHVLSGESYDDAIAREMLEETGIPIEKVSIRCLGHFTPNKDGLGCFSKVYEFKTNLVPTLDLEEFMQASWIRPEELLRRINSVEKAKSDLPILVRRFYCPRPST